MGKQHRELARNDDGLFVMDRFGEGKHTLMATDEGAKNGWELAARFATKMLPQIFRVDSPGLELEFPPEKQQQARTGP